ncbi:MAG: RNA 2',3'-cyclic phosphodiesterase [Rubricella sp.]
MRAFIGLPVEDDLADLALSLGAAIPGPGIRPVPEERLHVTLAFLGEIPERAVAPLAEEMAALEDWAVPLTPSGIGTFGKGDRVRSIHIRLAETPELMRLQARVERMLEGLGLPFERRRFTPHVTVARRAEHPLTEDQARWIAGQGDFEDLEGWGERLVLYRSHLREEGPIYTPIVDVPLAAMDADSWTA